MFDRNDKVDFFYFMVLWLSELYIYILFCIWVQKYGAIYTNSWCFRHFSTKACRVVGWILLNVTCQVIQSDLFGMVKWPFQRLSDLQLGDKKVTKNHLVFVCRIIPRFVLGKPVGFNQPWALWEGHRPTKICPSSIFWSLVLSESLQGGSYNRYKWSYGANGRKEMVFFVRLFHPTHRSYFTPWKKLVTLGPPWWIHFLGGGSYDLNMFLPTYMMLRNQVVGFQSFLPMGLGVVFSDLGKISKHCLSPTSL